MVYAALIDADLPMLLRLSESLEQSVVPPSIPQSIADPQFGTHILVGEKRTCI